MSSLAARHIDARLYYEHAFLPVGSSRNLTQFLVVESDVSAQPKPSPGDCPVSTRHSVADAYVYRANEMCEQLHVRTHLGNIVRPGDMFLGVDMRSLNHNNEELDKIDASRVPDVILIKKQYDRTLRRRVRQWHLKRLHVEDGSTNTDGEDRDSFCEDLEDDADMRANVNVYAREVFDKRALADAGDLPMVPLEEMIGNLDLSSAADVAPMAGGGLVVDDEMMDM